MDWLYPSHYIATDSIDKIVIGKKSHNWSYAKKLLAQNECHLEPYKPTNLEEVEAFILEWNWSRWKRHNEYIDFEMIERY